MGGRRFNVTEDWPVWGGPLLNVYLTYINDHAKHSKSTNRRSSQAQSSGADPAPLKKEEEKKKKKPGRSGTKYKDTKKRKDCWSSFVCVCVFPFVCCVCSVCNWCLARS